ncbi:GNAT family N-acetyltransferase [Enhygromyxa salina]|uniref:GNAT family N-acetyltransferase n=1 Tax=Enhygromyxa salina TaxID=215803 RepID=UPI0015E65CF3|nr:GNAT family N-acetyltransferase [Enhygromyxa salina]
MPRWLDPLEHEHLARWRALLQRTRHDFHQLPEYVAIEADRLGGRGVALLVEDPRAPERAALLPLILRSLPSGEGCDATSPYGYPGPLFTSADPRFETAAVGCFVAAMAKRDVASAFVRLHPLLRIPDQALARFGSLVDHGPTVWIDLETDEATQWANYRGTHRNLVRRATRDGLRVRFDDAFARLDEFYPIYAETMARLGATTCDMDHSYLQRLAAVLLGRGYLALVEHGDQVIAGGVFSSCSGIVQYHLSGTATAWQRASPSRLMLDEVRRRQAARGDWRMHLGGGVGAQEDPLFRFKRGFSSERGRFCSWRVTPNPALHDRLVADWQAGGGSREAAGEFFPLYRAPITKRASA